MQKGPQEALGSSPCSKSQQQHLEEHTVEPLPLSPPFPNGPVLQLGQAEGWWAWPMATGHSRWVCICVWMLLGVCDVYVCTHSQTRVPYLSVCVKLRSKTEKRQKLSFGRIYSSAHPIPHSISHAHTLNGQTICTLTDLQLQKSFNPLQLSSFFVSWRDT